MADMHRVILYAIADKYDQSADSRFKAAFLIQIAEYPEGGLDQLVNSTVSVINGEGSCPEFGYMAFIQDFIHQHQFQGRVCLIHADNHYLVPGKSVKDLYELFLRDFRPLQSISNANRLSPDGKMGLIYYTIESARELMVRIHGRRL